MLTELEQLSEWLLIAERKRQNILRIEKLNQSRENLEVILKIKIINAVVIADYKNQIKLLQMVNNEG